MVLEQGIDAFALEEVAVDDVVLDVVAVVHHKGEIDDQSGAFFLAVAAGVRLVGRQTVIRPELGLREAIHDEASAGAALVGGEIHETAHRPQVVIMPVAQGDGDVVDGIGRIGVDQRLLAARESQGQEQQQEREGFSHGIRFGY